MEGNYSVTFGQTQVGRVRVRRQGLYYQFICRCQLSGDVVCRLTVRCGGKQESLGILVPSQEGFGLDTKVSVKRIGEGEMEFYLMPSREHAVGTFVPLSPEEPFSYIARLKDAYFERRYGQAGVVLPDMKK